MRFDLTPLLYPQKGVKIRSADGMLTGQRVRLLAFPHVYKLKPEWFGWLRNPQNKCLVLFPPDALDFILGKF